MTVNTKTDVRSAAELERQRVARQAAEAEQTAESQAQAAESEVESQAQAARASVSREAMAARTQAAREAKQRKTEIRKLQGEAERQAQTALAKSREARAKEARKADLPITKPRALGLGAYMASVEAARQQAHKSGRDAKAEVNKVKQQYFKQVDQAESKAIAQVQRQKAGIVKDIRLQLVSYNADLTKQVARLSSGIKEWEDEANAAIDKAQADYEAAIQAQLNRPGTEVFADMKSQGLVPADAIYKDYDKATGQLNYTIPDNRTGAEIFAAEQAAGNIPESAKYKSYNSNTGQLTYEVPKKTGPYLNTTTNTTAPGDQTTNVVTAAAGGIAAASIGGIALAPTAGVVAAIPTPPTWIIGGILITTAAIIAIVNRERIAANIRHWTGKDETSSSSAAESSSTQASSAVVTNNAGTVTYTTAQIRIIPRTKESGMMTFPHTKLGSTELVTRYDVKVPSLPGFGLTQAQFQLPGTTRIPRTVDQIIIRDPFDVPELRQKGANLMYYAAAAQAAANNVINVATKELGLSRTESQRLWDQVNEHLRKARVRQGRAIIEDMARSRTKDVAIQRHMRLAYEDYLRKKAILDAARKSYIASLNPQPVKGQGASLKAIGAAAGVFLAQDIIQGAILRELNKGQDLKSAMSTAQTTIQSLSTELGLTQQQITAANAAVVYDLAVDSMTKAAVSTAAIGQTENWTGTQLQTKTFTATQSAINEVTQTAVNTGTLTKTQAQSMARELTRVAEQVATLTAKIKLPKPSDKQASGVAKETYPEGTIVWKMGETKRGDEWKIIPPPYTLAKPISSTTPPKGVKKTKGTPQQTLTFIGGKVPFKNVSFDLGITDGFIDVKARTINFTGEGEKTDVGKRQVSTTKGISLTDNPPLLQQLTKPKGKGLRKSQSRTKLALANSSKPKRQHLVSHGVYTDRSGKRITRRRKKGWRRIY